GPEFYLWLLHLERQEVLNEIEYDIIDELYFVTPYTILKEETDFSDEQLRENLVNLIKKGWVRVYSSVDEESELSKVNMQTNFRSYFYLASKKGLFEHNMR
ncbi:MAG: hypothetical protein AAF391_09790, partial [Bacteroidota bacterium]